LSPEVVGVLRHAFFFALRRLVIRRSYRRSVAQKLAMPLCCPIIAAMGFKTKLKSAWRSLWQVKKTHDAPTWARFGLAGALGMSPAILLSLLYVTAKSPNLFWDLQGFIWLSSEGIGIALAVTALLYTVELVLPAATLVRCFPVRDWRVRLTMTALLIGSALAGVAAGAQLGSVLTGIPSAQMFYSVPVATLHFLEFLVLLAASNWWWWRVAMKRQALQFQTMEAQLRLLQAQIEPHFLFNTLANVQSLIDHDAERAKQMLETFTDYLRLSLSQLRDADSSVANELGMVDAYLQLLQIRMEERLRYKIDADEAARTARLPTLLLQPLVENAIRHGLEPKLEGGQVRISVRLRDGVLAITVEDDGLGLHAPQRRGGSGMALDNLRERLQTRYAGHASFDLQLSEQGSLALLLIPHSTI
jgi:two-component sensor histidine kinase